MEGIKELVHEMVEHATAPNQKLMEMAKEAGSIFIVRSIYDQCPAPFQYTKVAAIDFCNDSDAVIESGTPIYVVNDVDVPEWLEGRPIICLGNTTGRMNLGALVIEGDDIFRAEAKGVSIPH